MTIICDTYLGISPENLGQVSMPIKSSLPLDITIQLQLSSIDIVIVQSAFVKFKFHSIDILYLSSQ